jgi:predicted alpha/beta superfamily hydrolase
MLLFSALRIALRRHTLLAFIFAEVFTGTAASAQSYTVPDWTADSIYSEVLNETRQISIALPVGYNFKTLIDARYPVLIVVDESYSAPLLATKIMTARLLSFMQDWIIPPMIIVSIDGGRNRVRDFTPPPVLGQPSPVPGRGGAPAFATFIADELLPWLADRYRTAPYTVLQGHSINGLFAAWVYGQRPDKINAVLALSPTIMWSDEAYRQILDGIRARTRPGRFFIAASEVEGTMIPGKTTQFLSDIARIPTPATTVLHQWYADVSHGQTDILGFTDGLRAIFRPIALAGLDGSMSRTAVYLPAFERRREAYGAAAPAFGLPPQLPLFFTLNQALSLATPEYRGLRDVIPMLCNELRTSYPGLWAAAVCDGYARLSQDDSDGAAAAFAEALRIAELRADPIGIGLARQGAAQVERARREGRGAL